MNVRLRSFRGHIEPGVWPGVVICIAYLGFAAGMLLQPARFLSTPAYGNLAEIFDIRLWGACYLVAALLLGGYISLLTSRLFGIVAHTVALIITAVWWLSFVIRWLTDANTTVVNVVSWLVFLLVIARSASLIPVAVQPHLPQEPHESH